MLEVSNQAEEFMYRPQWGLIVFISQGFNKNPLFLVVDTFESFLEATVPDSYIK